MRGLKHDEVVGTTLKELVASRRDAWIETNLPLPPSHSTHVASRRDAWIETHGIS